MMFGGQWGRGGWLSSGAPRGPAPGEAIGGDEQDNEDAIHVDEVASVLSSCLRKIRDAAVVKTTNIISGDDDSREKKDSGSDGGFLGALAKTAKNVLPGRWFKSKEEKKAEIQRQKAKDEFEGGVKDLLKDAPLPVRMVGGLVAPLMSTLAIFQSATVVESR